MTKPKIGVHATAATVRDTIATIERLEAAGLDTAWLTNTAQTPDPLGVFAAAAMSTGRIELGTSIVQTYPRHPLALVQEALVIDELAPGRLRLGVGPSGPRVIEPTFGIPYAKPTTHLREYVTILRGALHDGAVDFEGELLSGKLRLAGPTQVRVIASALRAKSFALAGELTDGAVSWMCARQYIRDVAAPSLASGAAAAGRERPPLVAHVPLVVSTDDAAVREQVPVQFGFYLKVQMYQNMFRDAGYPEAAEGTFSDRLIENLAIWGDEDTVRQRVLDMRAHGADEVLVSIISLRDDPAARERTIEVLGDLAKG
ncbi:MAG: LLM class flavin-dependent oxidoreductase [Dehalococcoidia bacterium]|nr:LLM class flavin-dependent oxidoreductase [Dehalococcoidia bacterium]